MPELLHVFSAGKMNKDFDERLVPNGEYRDALNLEITDSDGANVGTLQNMRGNIELTNKYYNPSTGVFTPWSTSYINALANPICIGKIIDNTTEKIYWLIASEGVSAIAEYDQAKDLITPILVDTQNILKFSKDYLITGINIIEGVMYFTDYQTEPKSLNINMFKALNTPDFQTHTQIYGRPFVESDVTVIKKSPLTAPALTVAASSAGSNQPGTGVDPVLTIYNVVNQENFTYIPNSATIESSQVYVSMPTFAEVENGTPQFPLIPGITGIVTFNVNIEPIAWVIGSIVNLKGSAVNDFNEQFEYQARFLVTNRFGTTVTAKILSISENIKKFSSPITWECVLEEKQPMFEFSFPRFSYRWKYKDNSFSCLAPFTEIAFVGGKFKYVSVDGYNTGMVNNLRLIKLENIEWGDESVVEIEILYKNSEGAPIYKVDSLKDRTVNTFIVESEVLGATLDSLQLLRPWDNVPRKAKAQEIVGNRLMFGNYYQNYNVSASGVNLSLSESRLPHPGTVNEALPDEPPYYGSIDEPFPSIKSIRTYQAGIVYRDVYGRETPVFTNKTASFAVPKDSAKFQNRLSIRSLNAPPSWATHFKYFIKETSSGYYNIALDRFYFAEDGNVWLSFPSSERNKLTEETYITIKKQHDNSTSVSEAARYKVLSIVSEAPEFISTFYKNETFFTCGPTSGFQTGFLTINFNGPSSGQNNKFYTGIDSSKYIVISSGGNSTGRYQVASGGPTGTSEAYSITLKKPLSEDAAWLGTTSSFTGPVNIDIYSLQPERLPEFDGRFFVKINRDSAFDTNIVNSFRALKKNYAITSEIIKKANRAGFSPGDSGDWGVYFQNDGGHCNDWWGMYDRNFRPNQKGTAAWNDLFGMPLVGSSYASIMRCGMGNRDSWEGYGAEFVNTQAQAGAFLRLVSNNGEVSSVPYKIVRSAHGGSVRGYRDPGKSSCKWSRQNEIGGNYMHTLSMELDRPIDDSWATSLDNIAGYQIVREIINDGNKIISSSNPAVFETEPIETVDLDLYYSASNNFPIAEHSDEKILSWHNCYSYGSGVESNRIRDDFNAPTMDKGPVVSTVLNVPYAEEIKFNGIIYSGIFNSISGVNNLNQFVQADTITKNLNPYYGSIQALLARDTDLITFCEDKILNILANKDALYNADGNQQLIGSNSVLGQTTPYVGEFGISKNPESLASYGFRTYFTDRARGTVLRLSRDGLEPIGDKGMTTFFFDNLPVSKNLIGVFDDSKGTYTLTLDNLTPAWQKLLAKGEFDRTNPDCAEWEPAAEDLTLNTTVVFKENADGWTSRMSFIPENGVSLNSIFYTFKNGRIWRHNDSAVPYNNFYNVQYDSSVNVLINDEFASVKGFKTLNYTGSESREYVYTIAGSTRRYSIAEIQANNLMPINFTTNKGWYANYIVTDLQEGKIKEFIKKEGKYFNYIKGLSTFFNTNCDNNVSSSEFAVQGIGSASLITGATIKTEYNVNVFANTSCFQYLAPPTLVPQSFVGLEDEVGVYSMGQTNECSSGIIIQLVNNNTNNGTLSAINPNGSFTFTPNPNYNGPAGSFTVTACCGNLCSEPTVMTLHIDPVADNPYFTTAHPALTGLGVGDCWEYPVIGIASVDYASTDLIIQRPVVGLPTWMSQPQPLNNGSGDWYIPLSCVPVGQAAGTIDFTLVVEDPMGNTGEQQVTGDTLVEALLALEFIGSSTSDILTAQTWTNPDDPTEVVVQKPRNANSSHSCNRGCYRVVANKQINGGLVIGRIWNSNSGKKGTATVPGTPGGAYYNTFTLSPTGIPNSLSQDPIAWAGTPAALAQGNLDSLGNPISYMYKNSEPEWGTDPANSKQRYVTTLHMPAIGGNNGQGGNRYSYLKITQTDADNIVANYADPANPSHITFTIEPDSYNSNGAINTHGTSVWFQIFKAGSTAGYAGGSEVFSNGLLTDCSAGYPCDPAAFPKIKIDVLTGSIIP